MPEILPELGALTAAGFLLLIAAALWVLQGLIRNSFGLLPVVGPWITTNINAALNDARNAVLSGASSSWGAAIQLFRWIQAFTRNPIAGIITAFAQVYSFGRKLVGVYIPDVQNAILQWAGQEFSAAEAYALSLWNQTTSYAAGLVSSALATVAGWVTTARNDALAAFDSLTVTVAADISAAETVAANAIIAASTVLRADIAAAEQMAAADAAAAAASVQSAFATLAGDIASGVATAETLAASNLAAVRGAIYTDLETWGDRAVADAWPDAQGDIGALRQALGADFPWLNDLLGALGGLGAAGLAGALIRSMATSHALTRLAADCVVPQCRNLGGLSGDLGNLLADASTAAMLAWLIFGVTDPAGWAQETASVAGPVASELAVTAGHLFGE